MVSRKSFIGNIRKDRFLSNSLFFFVGSTLASAGNYLFHFLMVRMLSVEEYGELQSLLALLVVVSIPTATLSTVLIKYVAHFKAKGQLNKVYSLFLFFTKRTLVVAIGFFLFFLVFSNYIAGFLKLSSNLPIIILGISFLAGFLATINGGVIQGLEKFKSASIIGIIGVCLKILLAVFFVKWSFGVSGVMGAIVLSGLIGYFIAFLPIRFLFGKQKTKLETREIFRYFLPVFFTLLFASSLYNIDIILVKHFLSPHLSGEYGALALLGHIVFFLGGPVIGVMFPMAAAAHAKNDDTISILKKTIILVSLVGMSVLLFYFVFPGFVIKALVGSKFLGISKLLGWFGVSMLLYSLVNLFARYLLSIHKIKCFYLLGQGVLLQILLLSVWHQSLWQIVWIMNGVMLITLLLLVGYHMVGRRRREIKRLRD